VEKKIGVATCQIDTVPGDIKGNLQALANSIKANLFLSPWVKLVCAPELCIQGILDMAAVAQEIPGEITRACSDLARQHRIYLVPGSIYEKKDNKIYNTAPVFDPLGNLIAAYRKMYPWRPHETYCSGDKTCVFDMPGIGRVGLCICLDLWFPEVIRDMVWQGAEVILIPTATSTADRRLELILAQAAAITNQCFIVNVNGTGKGGGGNGQSLIVDPEGTILQITGQGCENMAALLDLGRVETVRNFGTYGVTYPLAGFFHEEHRFDYQSKNYSESPIAGSLKKFYGKAKCV
jgi:predicted amidohydrolase